MVVTDPFVLSNRANGASAAPASIPRGSETFLHGPEAFAVGAVLVFGLSRNPHPEPCTDPRHEDSRRQEAEFIAAGKSRGISWMHATLRSSSR